MSAGVRRYLVFLSTKRLIGKGVSSEDAADAISSETPPPINTGKAFVIYKCNKYPKEYMMKLKKTLSLILLGTLCGFLGAYSIFSVCQEFDMDYSYESMIKEFNMEEY